MMRILLLGNTGQVGWESERTLAPLGEVFAYDYPQVDFTQLVELRNLVYQVRPDVIVNAVAYTAVDRAENEPEIARTVNAVAPGVLAEAARAIGAGLVHFSTDYVFDGTKGTAYCEEDAVHPLNEYGRTKLGGELAVEQVGGAYLIFRTSWVYSNRRDSFVAKVLQWSRQQPVLRMVTDQVGSPTWARMLAETTTQVLCLGNEDVASWLNECAGLYHLGGFGGASRLEWAQAILELDPKREEQLVTELQPALTEEFPTPACRPLYTALDCAWFQDRFGLRMPDWKDALRLAMRG